MIYVREGENCVLTLRDPKDLWIRSISSNNKGIFFTKPHTSSSKSVIEKKVNELMSFFYFAKYFCQEMRYLHEYIQNVKKTIIKS